MGVRIKWVCVYVCMVVRLSLFILRTGTGVYVCMENPFLLQSDVLYEGYVLLCMHVPGPGYNGVWLFVALRIFEALQLGAASG